ncbi:acetoacetyl-CoA synthetase-like [Uloborus diversus]|uniref:acetoacetyl-CoA synthetase-like n=1 Tax=Uloborus diversus TaxID=327109 RepID=UPI002409A0C7|nr:acetoacetyl-CoA synthetase-like [Uloborus diversus]
MAYIETWNPPISWQEKVPETEVEKFQNYLKEKHGLHFENYWELHDWSLKNTDIFWGELWHYLQIIASKPYEKVRVKTGPRIIDAKWYVGAEFNFAENLLRYRNDKTAIVYTDETGYIEKITFEELYRKVQLYAAAFRKHGLKKNDRLACHMSNRPENIYAFLAATSIGAVFGGIHSNYPAKSAKVILDYMEPKFLLVEESHQFDEQIFDIFSNLDHLIKDCSSLEKVVVFPRTGQRQSKNISHIKNGIYIDAFLKMSSIPPLQFAQLPPDHPVSIAFTSGTTGVPKGFVHAASSLVSFTRDFVFNWNLKEGDRIMCDTPPGCSMWDLEFPVLCRGASVLLYHGSLTNINYWDLVGQHEVTFAFLTPIGLIWMEEMGMYPGDKTSLDKLKAVGLSTSTAFQSHFDYLKRVKEDLFVANIYGTTETFGDFIAFNYNVPYHAPEAQIPALGVDIRCLDSNGNSVIGQRGEIVIASQYPAFPTNIWKDQNDQRLTDLYLAKHPGVWTVGDIGWFNPKTKGLMVIGRTVNVLKKCEDMSFITEDVYFAMHYVKEVRDCICITRPKSGQILLFVKLQKGLQLTTDLKKKIIKNIADKVNPVCVPDIVLRTEDIPYNLLHKKLERVVLEIIEKNSIPYVMNVENPESLHYFCNIPEIHVK